MFRQIGYSTYIIQYCTALAAGMPCFSSENGKTVTSTEINLEQFYCRAFPDSRSDFAQSRFNYQLET